MLSPTLPTDRDTETPELGVGVDTIAVQGPTTEALLAALQEQRFDREVDWETGAITDSPRFSSMYVQIGQAWGRLFGHRQDGQALLRAEVSLPAMLHGHNRNALGTEVLADAIDAVLVLLAEQLPDIPRLDQVAVQRLDLPRDFQGVESIHSVLAAVHLRHVPHAKVNEPYYGPDGRLQSLRRGTKRRYMVSAYGKGREMVEHARRDPLRAPALQAWAQLSDDRLRIEPQLHAPILREKGITTVADLEKTDLYDLSRDYFCRTRWVEPYGGRGQVQQVLEGLRPHLSPADYRNLCVYIFCATRNMDVPLTRHVLERVRPLARRHNLLDPEDARPRRRLDFTTGRETDA